MALKLKAIPLPDLKGKSVLDVGCDMRFWCDLAKDRGASKVVGVDRGREVKGHGYINMADYQMELGRQWHHVGSFDVIFMFSMYHHAYQSSGGDHDAIWFWLWNHLDPSGVLIWENPVNSDDVVVLRNVEPKYHEDYNEDAIMYAASKYFDIEFVGPALHEPTRYVFNFYPKRFHETYHASLRDGAGGASKAFAYADNRRAKEIEKITGVLPINGSLNLTLDAPFNWDMGYFRAEVLDVVNRKDGLDSEWKLRWARLYPVHINSQDAFVFRFETDKYPANFIELISKDRLRGTITETTATVWR